jgi:hypothetical protein
MPDKMPENIPDRMPEDLPIRNKIILFLEWNIIKSI